MRSRLPEGPIVIETTQPRQRDAVGEPTSSVRRAVGLLRVLVESGREMTVHEIASQMGLAPSTVHRLVSLLQAEGVVRKNERLRRYGVGGVLYRLSARVQSQVTVAEVAQPLLDSLNRVTGYVALLGWYRRQEKRFSFIAASDSRNPLSYRIDLQTPLLLFRGAAGKVILAHLPDEEYLEVLSEAEKYPRVRGSELSQQLERVHQEGFLATRNERLPGALGIAAPLFGVDDAVVGCVCIAVPLTSGDPGAAPSESQLAEAVREHARLVSQLLGAAGTAPDPELIGRSR